MKSQIIMNLIVASTVVLTAHECSHTTKTIVIDRTVKKEAVNTPVRHSDLDAGVPPHAGKITFGCYDFKTKKPLRCKVIEVSLDSGMSCNANENGACAIDGLPYATSIRFIISAPGYHPMSWPNHFNAGVYELMKYVLRVEMLKAQGALFISTDKPFLVHQSYLIRK